MAAGSAAAAAFAGADPTGWVPLDFALRAGLGAALALAAARTAPVLLTVLSAVASAVAVVGGSPADVLAPAAAGISLAMLGAGLRVPAGGALAGGLLANAVLRLHWPLATGASLVAGIVVCVPLLLVGYGALGERGRSRVQVAVLATFLFCFVGAVVGGLAALLSKSAVDEGVRAAREGLSAIGRNDREIAQGLLSTAAASFSDAEATVGAWWALPARAVPFVAQHSRAVDTMAGAGADLARVGVQALEEADPDRVRPRDGVVDLEAVAALRGPLGQALDSLLRADRSLSAVHSPWLVSPVATRLDDLSTRVDSATKDAELASRAADLAPGLLGGDEPRRYLLAILTPAEGRAAGGFMGSFGEITAVDGELDLVRTGRIRELTEGGDRDGRRIEGHPDYLARYEQFRPERFWGVVTYSPDFPTVADVMTQLYPQSGGREVDGVVAVDPFAFEALLEFLGPVSVAGWPEPLTADNAARVLLHDHYIGFDPEDRLDFLGEATEVVWDRLTSITLPGPGTMADSLGPAVDGRHLQLASSDPEEQQLFGLIGATGEVPSVRGDSLGWTTQNLSGNKIDWFLNRSATYRVTHDPETGEVRGELELTLRNDAPPDGLPHAIIGWGGDPSLGPIQPVDGENLSWLSLYTAMTVTELSVNGEPLDVGHQVELGRRVYAVLLRLGPRSTTTVRATLVGAVEPGAPYRLDLLRQAVVNPDRVSVAVSVHDDWEVTGALGADRVEEHVVEADWRVDGPRALTVTTDRAGGTLLERLERGG